jgi:surface antigen
MMRVVFLSSLLLISIISAPAVTQAQFGGMFGGRLETPVFTTEDRQIITEMAVNMLNADPDGSTRPRTNPKSGGSGNLSVIRSYEHNGLPCRDMELDKRTGDRKGRWAWRMCRIKDGAWKIAE